MSFAFCPIYTGDYLRDTRHLTPQKHGIYLLLLMHCWDQKGPVPLDEQEAAGIANCRSADEIESLRYVLGRYFVKMADGWYQGRMQREIERSENISKARSSAGRAGYQAKAKQLLSKSKALASTPTPTPTPTPIPTPKTGTQEHAENGGAQPRDAARGTRLPPDWKPHADLIAWARKERPDLRLEKTVEAFREFWLAKAGANARKVDWNLTFRTWVRNEKRRDLIAQDSASRAMKAAI